MTTLIIKKDFFGLETNNFFSFFFCRPRVLSRRHSRASSVDRREIFTKYITRDSEHSDTIHPYENHDPELSPHPSRNEGVLDFKDEDEETSTIAETVNNNGNKRDFQIEVVYIQR